MCAQAAGFWSYVHDDDEDGRITKLARQIRSAYAMFTAESLELFLDREHLDWGPAWEERIDEAITGTTFFIPIITPRYFQSDACRSELVRFASRASGDLRELILPVYYVPVRELEEEAPEDELVQLIQSRQWEDWRELRLEDFDSSAARKGVSKMATTLAAITERVEAVPELVPPSADDNRGDEDDEEAPGLVDVLAQSEVALPRMSDALTALASETKEIGRLTDEANAELEAADARGAGFAGRLKVIRDLAKRLDPHAQRVEHLGRDYGTALIQADHGVHALLDGIEAELPETEDPESAREALDLLRSVQELADSTAGGMDGLRGFLQVMESMSTFSRDMRPPAKRISKGLKGMVDGYALIEEWGRRAREIEEQYGSDNPLQAQAETNG